MAENRPPVEEEVRLPAFWLAEVFTPSTFGRLEKGLEELGLHRSRTAEDRRTFIRESRGQAWPGAWSNLDWLASSKKDRLLGQAIYVSDLPDSVRYAVPTVLTVTPSLTVLVVQFQLRDEAAGRLERAARADYLPTGEAHWDGSSTFRMAEGVRDAALKGVRTGLRRDAEDWIARHFPGAFSELDGPLPAAEFITLKEQVPFPAVDKEPHYLRMFGLSSLWPPFESAELPGIKLVTDVPFEDEPVLCIAAKLDEALADPQLTQYASADEFSLLQRLNEALELNIAQYALICLLQSYHRSLSQLRDVAPSKRTSARASLRQLKRIRAGSIAQSVDIQSSTAEILDTFRSAAELRHNASEWTERDEPRPGPKRVPRELADVWAWELRERAERLAALEARLRAALQADAAILSAIANLRIQRWLLPATLGALVVAIVSVLIALSK